MRLPHRFAALLLLIHFGAALQNCAAAKYGESAGTAAAPQNPTAAQPSATPQVTPQPIPQLPAPAIQPIPWAAPDGSTQLWNGKDITGWTIFLKGGIPVPPDFWSASGGVLHFAGKPTGYLRTDKSYSNYHLHAEWRWLGPPAKGTNNSGIFVFQHPPDAVWPYSIQVQVKAGSCGDLLSQAGLLFPAPNPNPTMKRIGDSVEKPAGEWNGYDIYCRGASLELYINALRQNYVDKLPTDSGQIALQCEGYPIEFRNIWLQPLQ